MKRSLWKISLILGIMILILPGCLDIWITTTIRPNGSIEQSISFQGDSAEIISVPFALMNDKDWKREWTIPVKDSAAKHKLVLSKEFKSVKELNKTMNPADTNLLTVRVNASLKQKFRWFFTRYIYQETVLEANPFLGTDYHQYLTDEDIRLIAMKEDERKADPAYDSVKYKKTEKQFEEYLFRNIFEDFYQELLSVLNEDKSLTLTKQALDQKKDVIYHMLVDSVKADKPDDILKAIGDIVNHPDIQVIRLKHLDRFDGFNRREAFFNLASDDNYNFAISMPGLLLQTNSEKIEGSKVSWELSYYDFFFKDYTMTAESRKVNTWAFIVAGLIMLIALTSLVSALIKKR